MDKLKQEHALALNEVVKLQREYSAAVLEVQELTHQYNKVLENDGFTLVVKRSRTNTKKRNKKAIERPIKRPIERPTKKTRKRKIMEDDPFKPKPSLFGFHPWGDYESD
tara:strand:- start:480 stop:806 length:327 start_codon:yes stop_codon:yes gene_type:complete